MLEIPTTSPLENRIRFHAPHLERVSRSFAFGIARLDEPLRASVGLGYLICRILDTVEDAQWSAHHDQMRAFQEFDEFTMGAVTDPQVIRAWVERFPKSISSGEKQLLDDAAKLFKEFNSLSAEERRAMLNPVLSMSRGMKAFAERRRQTGVLRLRDLTDVNVYCFFVAGVVGELLTGLVQNEMRPIGRESVLELGTHFGLFLQKINVLKDQESDQLEGRFLIPDRELLFASLYSHALSAFDYLRSIPPHRRDYRLFCAWALYLGLATVPRLRRGERKLPRVQALALGARIDLAILDDEKLKALFDDLLSEAWPTTALTPTGSVETSRQALEPSYLGALNLQTLAELLAGKGPHPRSL